MSKVPKKRAAIAKMGDLGRKRAGGNAGLQIGKWAESGEVQAAAEFFSIEEVVEGVQASDWLDAGWRVPEGRAG